MYIFLFLRKYNKNFLKWFLLGCFFLILVKNNGQWGRFYPRLFCFSWIVVNLCNIKQETSISGIKLY